MKWALLDKESNVLVMKGECPESATPPKIDNCYLVYDCPDYALPEKHMLEEGNWVELKDAKEKSIRDERDFLLLLHVDPIVTNTLRWQDLSEEQKTQIKDYRKSLLDLTDQASFPDTVEWPKKPDFIK